MIPRDAVDIEDWERMERGLPPRPKKKVVRIPPEAPAVPDQVRFEDIPDQEIKDFSARGRTVKNKEGARFTGYTFFVEFTNKKTIQGWMPEGEFAKLKARIPRDRVDLLGKIGW